MVAVSVAALHPPCAVAGTTTTTPTRAPQHPAAHGLLPHLPLGAEEQEEGSCCAAATVGALLLWMMPLHCYVAALAVAACTLQVGLAVWAGTGSSSSSLGLAAAAASGVTGTSSWGPCMVLRQDEVVEAAGAAAGSGGQT